VGNEAKIICSKNFSVPAGLRVRLTREEQVFVFFHETLAD
jgi:hypothetical protein